MRRTVCAVSSPPPIHFKRCISVASVEKKERDLKSAVRVFIIVRESAKKRIGRHTRKCAKDWRGND